MPDRDWRRDQFLAHHGWKTEHRNLLADDASFRSYDRLIDGDRRAVLMNAPPPEEDTRPFVQIAGHLKKCGLRAPDIYAADTDQGFLLLEDFGDRTYTQVLKSDPDQERALYELAVDVLIHLHRQPPSLLAPETVDTYSTDHYLREVRLFTDWYLPRVLDEALPKEALVSYEALWSEAFDFVAQQSRALVLRDFHVDNLVWLPDAKGISACGLLDFQDALVGSNTYDLMSLLEDARRDVSDDLADHLKARYYAAFPALGPDSAEREAFEAAYAITGAGRHAKVIGIFTRLCFRDAKPDYLIHIPRVWKLLERSLTHPMLEGLADWIETYVPVPGHLVPDVHEKEN